MTLIPRYYQREAVQSIYDYYASGETGNPIIALPTGTGKSILPAIFIKEVMSIWPTQRFSVVTHSRKLIKQNYDKMIAHWPNAPIGIYSAGLKRKESIFPIVYGGIGSMYKKAELFGHRDICFVDEAHCISPDEDTMYQQFFKEMLLINPNMKTIAMTATPFRMGHGRLDDGKLFHKITYDGTSYQKFNQFIADGFISPLVGIPTNVKVDTKGIKLQNGEFSQSQLEKAVDKVTREGLIEFCQIAANRRCWLLFAGGIDNAEFMANILNEMGIPTAAVHSRLSNDEIDRRLQAHENGQLRAITNYGILTTGYDCPQIDAIGMFRCTMSSNLHVQMGGRGTRPYPGKLNCLYADYGRNIERLGPINDPVMPRKKGEGKGEVPVKICDNCGIYNHISARVCEVCGAPFEFQVKIKNTAEVSAEVLREDFPKVEMFDVFSIVYKKHYKPTGSSLKVTYNCGIRSFTEFVAIENPNAKKFALDWFRQRSEYEMPNSVDLILEGTDWLRRPKAIKVWVNNIYNGKITPKIMSYEWG